MMWRLISGDSPAKLQSNCATSMCNDRRASELFNPGAGAFLVFLCGPAANAAGTDQDTLAEDRHGALTIEHVASFGRGDAAQSWMVGTWRKVATRAAKGGRGDGLALAAEGASPHGAIHALKGKEPSTGVAHGDIHLGADLVCLLDGSGDHAIGICEGQGHEVNPFRSETHQDAGASRVAGRPGHANTTTAKCGASGPRTSGPVGGRAP